MTTMTKITLAAAFIGAAALATPAYADHYENHAFTMTRCAANGTTSDIIFAPDDGSVDVLVLPMSHRYAGSFIYRPDQGMTVITFAYGGDVMTIANAGAAHLYTDGRDIPMFCSQYVNSRANIKVRN